jgi:SAM-dependent methyltransferase
MVEPPIEMWRSADERRARFDANALAYDTFRPGYPEATFEDLTMITGLQSGDHVVEVGAGTGLATLPLARRGLVLTCVEPGSAMAAIAREKLSAFSNITYVQERFEDWDPPSDSARAVVAANAWHWVKPDIGFSKAASILGNTGHLCLLFHHVVQIGPDGFENALRDIRQAITPPREVDLQAGAFMEEHRWSDDLEASGLFTHVATARHAFQRDLSSTEFVAVADTYGPASELTHGVRAELSAAVTELIDTRYDGHIVKREEAVLYVGARRSDRLTT